MLPYVVPSPKAFKTEYFSCLQLLHVLYDPLKPFSHIQSHTVRINVRSVSRRIISYFTTYTYVTELPMGVGPKVAKWRRHQRKLYNIKPQTARSRGRARTVWTKASSQYSNTDTKLRPRRNDVGNIINLSFSFPLPASSLDPQIPRVLLPLIPNNDTCKNRSVQSATTANLWLCYSPAPNCRCIDMPFQFSPEGGNTIVLSYFSAERLTKPY